MLFVCSALLLLLLLVRASGDAEDGCNEFVCGSVVSKCLLTQSCQCKLSDCHCCKDCLNCLGDLYTECCSCLDMCPQHNETLGALAPKSQIGDFDGVPELFETLTAEEDDEQWTVMRFPMRIGMRRHYDKTLAAASYGQRAVTGGGGGGGGGGADGGGRRDAIDRQATLHKAQHPLAVNCTVIYLNGCTTNKKCTQYCESMGANSYRWFHDGCCECVGANCFNYGINESRCAACPEDDAEANGLRGVDEAEDDDYDGSDDGDNAMWDYGEDEINYN